MAARSAALSADAIDFHPQQGRTTRAAKEAAAAEKEEQQQAAIARAQILSQEFKSLPFETSSRLSMIKACEAPPSLLQKLHGLTLRAQIAATA